MRDTARDCRIKAPRFVDRLTVILNDGTGLGDVRVSGAAPNQARVTQGSIETTPFVTFCRSPTRARLNECRAIENL